MNKKRPRIAHVLCMLGMHDWFYWRDKRFCDRARCAAEQRLPARRRNWPRVHAKGWALIVCIIISFSAWWGLIELYLWLFA